MGYGGQWLRAVRALYADVPMSVTAPGLEGRVFSATQGLKQGCPLSPTLFSLYIADWEERVLLAAAAGMPLALPQLAGQPVPPLLYADDMALLATTANGLQQQLWLLEQYCAERGLTVNVVKTKVMLLSGAADEKTAMQRVRRARHTFDGAPVAGVAAFKYLGISRRLPAEDRICGTIDIEKALTEGVKAYEPGLLARANRGILYVDEVNLLDDGLVDVVLDAAAGGVNTVEPEGISIVHPAKFIMIGSGNLAEGELRPQLLDRFGLSVQPAQEELRHKLQKARDLLPKVQVSRELKLKISELCSFLEIDGVRGDITINKAVRAFVAFEGRTQAAEADLERIAPIVLNHRMRKDPLDPIDGGLKVRIALRRLLRPAEAKAEEAKKKAEAEEAKAKKAAENKKAGAHRALPLVCRALRQLANSPALNPTVVVTFTGEQRLLRLRSFCCWFGQQRASVRRLSLQVDAAMAHGPREVRAAALLAAALAGCGAAGCQLWELQLGLADLQFPISGWLSELRSLRSLAMRRTDEDMALHVDCSLAGLTHLLDLSLDAPYDGLEFTEHFRLPTSLTRLHLGGQGSSVFKLSRQISQLSQLQALSLSSCGSPAAGYVPLAALPALRRLALDRPIFLPDCLPSLHLDGGGRGAYPPAVPHLAALEPRPLPGVAWVAGLREITTTCEALAASLPALAGAAALETVHVACAAGTPEEHAHTVDRLRAVLRWGGRLPALRTLALAVDDATLARVAGDAVDVLRPSRACLLQVPGDVFDGGRLRQQFVGPDSAEFKCACGKSLAYPSTYAANCAPATP
ncbi:magnesium chelatase subunit of protochlorophyllide reductase isoform A [Micractinium conductrix]|uniref:magnesium chelatase n=1 Tax=Micractinium conductrix TaxID=554055 RepID=A0A2P6VGJ1_9CHLO|nr:magnesium chelatase subunit of protochlorophyllide reductase isoform A [Micractinium conductrix]|eukprot:PSC73200.1 magnesium chelatase subunit of protochlorophyllide reductase isoform A [Micractinium conductrix]